MEDTRKEETASKERQEAQARVAEKDDPQDAGWKNSLRAFQASLEMEEMRKKEVVSKARQVAREAAQAWVIEQMSNDEACWWCELPWDDMPQDRCGVCRRSYLTNTTRAMTNWVVIAKKVLESRHAW